jgi:glucokinase
MLPILAMDIGGTDLKAALVSDSGQVLASRRVTTPPDLDRFARITSSLLQELTGTANGIAGLGIGCKGIINTASSRVDVLPGPLHYLEGLLLSDLLAAALPPGLPVLADNDARVALAGERVWGAARGKDNVLMLTLGTGVGGAIISGGRILRGETGVAGHLGHLTVDTDGEPCICGNRGCLETVFSARAIESRAHAIAHRGVASAITERATAGPLSCSVVFDLARDGDALAIEIIRRATRVLAGAIAGLSLTLDPGVIILGGQIAQAGNLLFDPLREDIAWRTRGLLRREVPVVPSELSDPSGVLGAAALVIDAIS